MARRYPHSDSLRPGSGLRSRWDVPQGREAGLWQGLTPPQMFVGSFVLLIQLGGLGMLAFTTLIIVALGRRLSLRAEMLAGTSRDAAPHIDTK